MRVIFIGTGEIGLPTLRMLLESTEHQVVAAVTQPDKPTGREQRITAPPLKTALSNSVVPILQPARIRRDDAIAEIRTLNPDVIVVIAYGQILPRAVLNLPRYGCLNLHASLLPRWRGAAPIQAAIMAGDSETGITVMYMDEGLDTGDILLQQKFAIGPDETAGTLHDRLAELAPTALKEALALLGDGKAPRTRQDSRLASYAPKLEREHGRIDWNEAGELIERKIRAFNPWPGAFTTLCDPKSKRERSLKVYRAKLLNGVLETPGKFLRNNACNLLVAAVDSVLVLIEVQLEGSRRMTGSELLRGHSWVADGVKRLNAGAD